MISSNVSTVDHEKTSSSAAAMLKMLRGNTILNLGSGRPIESSSRAIFSVDHDCTVLTGGQLSLAATCESLPFRDDSFNGILAKDVVEHVLDPILVLKELARVAADGCTIVATVPRAIPRAVWADPTHVRGFTKESLQQLLDLAGWKVQGKIRRIGAVPLAGRLRLNLSSVMAICAVPGIGHWFGTNWFVKAKKS